MTQIKDDDKTWLHWYWLEFQDWIREYELVLIECVVWIVVAVLFIKAVCMILL